MKLIYVIIISHHLLLGSDVCPEVRERRYKYLGVPSLPYYGTPVRTPEYTQSDDQTH